MKKLLVIAAVTLASASAFATKARLNALSYPMSRQLTDVQTIFVNPSDLTLMGSWVTFETGTTNTGVGPVASPNAEAGFARSMGDARWGFYLGHTGVGITTDDFVRGGALRPAGYLIQENPMNLFYATKLADMSWGLGLNYSKSDRGAIVGSQSGLGATVGMRMGFWDASLNVDITDTAETGVNKWTGKTGGDFRVGYVMDTMYYYGQYEMAGGKSEASGVATKDLENNRAALGVVNTMKSEGGEFFYGAALQMTTINDKTTTTGNKVESLQLPVVIGIEADAASWLVLRGSVTQTVLLNSQKTTPATGASTEGTAGNNTRVAAGTGIKFNKFMLDTSLAAQTTGAINGASLLANAALVYNF